jgi:pyridoxamine 5'-phosphate oxidase
MTDRIAKIRKEYTQETLQESEVALDPSRQFEYWFQEALRAELPEPNAMFLSTVDADGFPNGRVVLLKGLDARGFVFYTNYGSKKGQELASNAMASLTFFWQELERQVRVRGRVERVSEAESDEYFASRPRGSQIGAWVSEQSTVIQSREVLEERTQAYEVRFANQEVPRPPHWGGYRVLPFELEFWQGRHSRLHDRIRYRLDEPTGTWLIERLSP